MKVGRTAPACLLALSVFASASARADDRRAAAEMFRIGSAAYARGEYRAAALSFEAAYAQAPLGAAAYDAGLAWEQAAEPARAADDLSRALAAPDLTPAQRADALARLDRLERTVGRLDVVAPSRAQVSVGEAEAIPAPARVHVRPATHIVRVVLADGRSLRREVVVAAGQRVAVSFDAPAGPAPAEAAPVQALVPRTAAPPDAPEPVRAARPQRTAGFIVLGSSAIFAGVAGVLWSQAVRARDEFDASMWHDRDAHDRADALRTWTNVAWVGCGVAALTGAVLILTSPRAASPAPRSSAGPY